jgi:hypothetical protein
VHEAGDEGVSGPVNMYELPSLISTSSAAMKFEIRDCPDMSGSLNSR